MGGAGGVLCKEGERWRRGEGMKGVGGLPQLQANSWSCPGKQDQPGQGREGGQKVMTQGVEEQTSQRGTSSKAKAPSGEPV